MGGKDREKEGKKINRLRKAIARKSVAGIAQ